MAELAFLRNLCKSRSCTCAAFLLFASQANPARAEGTAPDVLRVAAKPPVVAVEPAPPGRHFLNLPTLEYVFEVGTRCSGNDTPESLSINIADSRLVLTSDALEDDARQAIVLTVPAKQIAPIAVNGFCEREPDPDEAPAGIALGMAPVAANRDRVTVSAALSAQVSLLCGDEDERQMTYVTQPLDVTLACEAPVPVNTDLEPEQPPD